MENDLIRRSDILESLGDRPENWMDSDDEIQACADWDAFQGIVTRLPAVDAVPWDFLERYADWFCAAVSMPEFIREAKAFYKSTNAAMDGGMIGERREDGDGDG